MVAGKCSHCPSDHNAHNDKEVEAAFEQCNPDAYKKHLEQKAAWLYAQPPTPLCLLQLMCQTLPLLEARCQNLAVSAASLHELHDIWKQSHQGSSGNQNYITQHFFCRLTFIAV